LSGVLALTLLVAGAVEIIPLYLMPETMETLTEKEDNIRPYTALELEGRDIYIREGCYLCHSQMIRPFRDEKERYGHYSLAVESKYDHPFQWGSKRTGPDLARVGGKYSDEWHHQHLMDPRALVPESVMPRYPWLAKNTIDAALTEKKMRALSVVGVPYTEADFAGAASAVKGKTEMEAMIAYLQVLGTMVEFQEGKDYRQ
jgi:cytochrome c oxidase cbb3-type subunit 2